MHVIVVAAIKSEAAPPACLHLLLHGEIISMRSSATVLPENDSLLSSIVYIHVYIYVQ